MKWLVTELSHHAISKTISINIPTRQPEFDRHPNPSSQTWRHRAMPANRKYASHTVLKRKALCRDKSNQQITLVCSWEFESYLALFLVHFVNVWARVQGSENHPKWTNSALFTAAYVGTDLHNVYYIKTMITNAKCVLFWWFWYLIYVANVKSDETVTFWSWDVLARFRHML